MTATSWPASSVALTLDKIVRMPSPGPGPLLLLTQ